MPCHQLPTASATSMWLWLPASENRESHTVSLNCIHQHWWETHSSTEFQCGEKSQGPGPSSELRSGRRSHCYHRASSLATEAHRACCDVEQMACLFWPHKWRLRTQPAPWVTSYQFCEASIFWGQWLLLTFHSIHRWSSWTLTCAFRWCFPWYHFFLRVLMSSSHSDAFFRTCVCSVERWHSALIPKLGSLNLTESSGVHGSCRALTPELSVVPIQALFMDNWPFFCLSFQNQLPLF